MAGMLASVFGLGDGMWRFLKGFFKIIPPAADAPYGRVGLQPGSDFLILVAMIVVKNRGVRKRWRRKWG
jgi:hypothetical protein